VAINGAENSALLAIQMLALSDDSLAIKLAEYKEKMAAEVAAKDEKICREVMS